MKPDAHRLVGFAPNVTRHAVLVEAAAYVRRMRDRRSPGERDAYGNGFDEACEIVLEHLEAEAAKALNG